MEPVYCQNGHPNRPGTRICAICRTLIPPAGSKEPATTPPPLPEPPVAASPVAVPPAVAAPVPPGESTSGLLEDTAVAAPAPRDRRWLWLFLLLAFGALCAVAMWAIVLPGIRSRGELPTLAKTATTAPIAATDPAVLVEPTESSSPTATLVPPATATDIAPRMTATDSLISPTAVATVTPMPTIVGVIITPTFSFGRDVNFIQNGGFDGDWANGWASESRGSGGTIGLTVAGDKLQASAVRLEHVGPGMLRLAQRVVPAFPAEGLVFRARLRLTGTANGVNEGRSALILRYEDVNGEPIGASVWLDDAKDQTALWGSDPMPQLDNTVSVHIVGRDWQDIELWLNHEFADSLPRIDPIDVRQITVVLVVLGGDGCSAAGCPASLEASGLSLTAEAP